MTAAAVPGTFPGPVHTVTVHITVYRHADGAPEVRYDIEHPAECDRLRYGQLCDLGALLHQFGYLGCAMPTVPGAYCVNYWRTVLDQGGRYEHGVAATPAPTTPAVPAAPSPVGDGAGHPDAGQGPA
jgi:hypothetical protein